METASETIRKNCDKCGTVFELAQEKEKSVKKRQELFPDVAEVLAQELICCEDCAVSRMLELL